MYVLECSDGSLYCGITTDPTRRLLEHNNSPRGAKYTRSRRPVRQVFLCPCQDRSEAARVEFAFKLLTRREKMLAISRKKFDVPPG
jgi:putative endonuclease